MVGKLVDLGGGKRDRDEGNYEAKVVTTLLRFYKLTQLRRELMYDMERETDEPRLSLWAFHRKFPGYPMFFRVCFQSQLKQELTGTRLLHTFDESKLFKLRKNMRDLIPESQRGKPFGLVFSWPGSGCDFVLHNKRHNDRQGIRTVVRRGHVEYCCEPLRTLLETMEWSPEECF